MDSDNEQKPDIKPKIASSSQKLTITITHDGRDIKVAVKPTQEMKRVFEAAGKAFGVDYRALRFMYGNQRVREKDTPEKLDMEDQDEITTFLEQLGGSSISPSVRS